MTGEIPEHSLPSLEAVLEASADIEAHNDQFSSIGIAIGVLVNRRELGMAGDETSVKPFYEGQQAVAEMSADIDGLVHSDTLTRAGFELTNLRTLLGVEGPIEGNGRAIYPFIRQPGLLKTFLGQLDEEVPDGVKTLLTSSVEGVMSGVEFLSGGYGVSADDEVRSRLKSIVNNYSDVLEDFTRLGLTHDQVRDEFYGDDDGSEPGETVDILRKTNQLAVLNGFETMIEFYEAGLFDEFVEAKQFDALSPPEYQDLGPTTWRIGMGIENWKEVVKLYGKWRAEDRTQSIAERLRQNLIDSADYTIDSLTRENPEWEDNIPQNIELLQSVKNYLEKHNPEQLKSYEFDLEIEESDVEIPKVVGANVFTDIPKQAFQTFESAEGERYFWISGKMPDVVDTGEYEITYEVPLDKGRSYQRDLALVEVVEFNGLRFFKGHSQTVRHGSERPYDKDSKPIFGFDQDGQEFFLSNVRFQFDSIVGQSVVTRQLMIDFGLPEIEDSQDLYLPSGETVVELGQRQGISIRAVEMNEAGLKRMTRAQYFEAFAGKMPDGTYGIASFPVGLSEISYLGHDVANDHLNGVVFGGQEFLDLLQPAAIQAVETGNLSQDLLDQFDLITSNLKHLLKFGDELLGGRLRNNGKAELKHRLQLIEDNYKKVCDLTGVDYREGSMTKFAKGRLAAVMQSHKDGIEDKLEDLGLAA